jgi:hypothetical protein
MESEILQELKEIKERLDKIERTIGNQQIASTKMVQHIDFIDNIYENVKKPFSRALSFYTGNTVVIEKESRESRDKIEDECERGLYLE